MEKLSTEQVEGLLRDSATTIRKQAAENKALRDKLAAKELRERADKVASAMHGKGLNLDMSREALVESLEKEAAEGRLETIEKAVDLVGPDMGTKIGQAAHQRSNDESGNGSSDFVNFIIGG